MGATVPQRMTADLVRTHPLRILKPPVEIPGCTMASAGTKSTATIPVIAVCGMHTINAAEGRNDAPLKTSATPN